MTRSEELSELLITRKILLDLKEGPGYKYMLKALEESKTAKMVEVTSSPRMLLSEQARTYVAGELNALTFVLGFVDVQISALDTQIESLTLLVEAEEVNS